MNDQIILSAEERKELRKDISEAIISTKEALEILSFSRARLHLQIKNEHLEQVGYGVYLKADILAFKKAFEVARSNNEWIKDFK